ncbi:MAG: hypothetical protein KC766_16775 [Myxococcales bacterium]|nr:hypothetical protein [Myxococcales bacterium]
MSFEQETHLLDSPRDPRLITIRKHLDRLDARPDAACSVGHNDGRLFALRCYLIATSADGAARPGGMESHVFEWNGKSFEPLTLESLLPGAGGLSGVLEGACKVSTPPGADMVRLGAKSLDFVFGLAPMMQSSCSIDYLEHAAWVGCGPLAYRAGFAARAPAPDTATSEPLGWESGRVMGRLQTQQELVATINERLHGFDQAASSGYDLRECTVLLNTPEVISLRCAENITDVRLRLNYSVASGAELDAAALKRTVGGAFEQRVARACAKDYGARRGARPLRPPVKFSLSDLSQFELTSAGLRFFVKLPVRDRDGTPVPLDASCQVPFPALKLSLKKLGAVKPAQ